MKIRDYLIKEGVTKNQLVCMVCGKKFSKKLDKMASFFPGGRPITSYTLAAAGVKCPKCGSTNVEMRKKK